MKLFQHLIFLLGHPEAVLRVHWNWVPPGPFIVLGLITITPNIGIYLFFSMLRTYSSEADLVKDGASLFLRPWQCPFRGDYGLRGTADGDPLPNSVCFAKLGMCILLPNRVWSSAKCSSVFSLSSGNPTFAGSADTSQRVPVESEHSWRGETSIMSGVSKVAEPTCHQSSGFWLWPVWVRPRKGLHGEGVEPQRLHADGFVRVFPREGAATGGASQKHPKPVSVHMSLHWGLFAGLDLACGRNCQRKFDSALDSHWYTLDTIGCSNTETWNTFFKFQVLFD